MSFNQDVNIQSMSSLRNGFSLFLILLIYGVKMVTTACLKPCMIFAKSLILVRTYSFLKYLGICVRRTQR